jgi:desulfoferrodoxin (superoxide reductase-like protein)
MRIFKETFQGVGYIAHAKEKSHYIEFQKIFLSGFKKNKSVRYTTSEDIMAALDKLGIKYEESTLKYENKAASDDRSVVEAYLQRCVFDDTIRLEDLENNTQTRDYILQCKDQNGWSFSQEVSLIRVL